MLSWNWKYINLTAVIDFLYNGPGFMDLTWLRSFVAVAETLSFTKASAGLRVSQPTLSHQVRLLEEEIGLQLLDRSTHHVQLTQEGRAILAASRRIFAEIGGLKETAKELREGLAGEIAIGTVPSVGTYILPFYLQTLRKQFPAIRISILSKPANEILLHLSEGTIDVGFVTAFADETFPQYEGFLVSKSELVFICGPQCQNRCPNYERNNLKFTELAWERIIYYDARSPEQQAIVKKFAGQGVQIKPLLESEQIETIKKMAEAGMGCAILPAYTVREEVESGRLTQKTWLSSEMPVRVLALCRRNRTRLRSLDAFLNLFKAGKGLRITNLLRQETGPANDAASS